MTSLELKVKVEEYLKEKLPFLKFNKKREIERLIFEIAKIKKDYTFSFIEKYKNYKQFKEELLRKRYPKSFNHYPLNSFYLPELKLNEGNSFIENKDFLKPDELIIEKDIDNHKIIDNITKKWNCKTTIINSFKETEKKFDIKKYNQRAKKIYLIKEKFDFIKKCPCTKSCISCGYYVINLGFGCPMECEYCFLQSYQNFDGIILPVNPADFVKKIIYQFNNTNSKIRIGSGEFTDSLIYDDVTEYSYEIANLLKEKENIIFEFKTKTKNIYNFFKIPPQKNIVVSYSLNPQKIIDITEHYTASLKERILSMKDLTEYGYYTAIHFDPIIIMENWEELYKYTIDEIFSIIDKDKILWISLGTFRFKPETKIIIEDRFKENKILDAELILDFDRKLRYPYELRKNAYSHIINILRTKKFSGKIYLCMEEAKMWKDLNLDINFKW